MSQFFVAAQNGGLGAVTSVTGGNNITATPTTGAVVVNVSGTTPNAVQIGNPANGALESIALGTTGQILTSQGPGLPPIFSNPNTANAYTNITSAMSPYSVLLTDFFISVDATAGNVTIILPAAPGVNQEYVIKDRLGQAANHLISVTTQGGDTIDGQANYLFTDPYESIDILFHANNFEIF